MRGTSRRPIAYSARLPARHVGVVQSVHDVVTGYCMCAASAAALHLQQSCLPGRHWRHMRTDGAHYESTPSRTHIHSYSHSFDIQTAIEQDAVASCCALWVEVTTVNWEQFTAILMIRPKNIENRKQEKSFRLKLRMYRLVARTSNHRSLCGHWKCGYRNQKLGLLSANIYSYTTTLLKQKRRSKLNSMKRCNTDPLRKRNAARRKRNEL